MVETFRLAMGTRQSPRMGRGASEGEMVERFDPCTKNGNLSEERIPIPEQSGGQDDYGLSRIGYATSVRAIVTFYTPTETCPKGQIALCKTAWGKGAVEGRTVACPRRYDLGQRISIFGAALICEDRTALKHDGRWDIFIEDYALAKEIGIQETEVIICPPTL
jgi:hypothetical protein